ncbi:ABC transporter ATP-binding protein [Actinomycetaceae bacterium MB13-C1-2]|nr:ABC transporter ATP-binding protein [Actinomycetaceae bacterium MB13-C1-2]
MTPIQLPDAPGRAGLTVDSVSVEYRLGRERVRAVDHVSFHLEPGQTLALLGPSGCGKSTLLRAIAGLEPLSSGSVSWDGQNFDHVPTHERGFGMMFQDGQLFTHRNVGGNVAYGLKGTEWGASRETRDARVAEVLELVGLPGYQKRTIGSLSGGQAQRVALARLLARSPRLMLFDEPLSSLDRSLRERLADDLRVLLHDGNMTAVYVTHDPEEAETVADQIARMNEGRIENITPAARTR